MKRNVNRAKSSGLVELLDMEAANMVRAAFVEERATLVVGR